MRTKASIVLVAALASTVAALATSASGATRRLTRGDATAVLNAFGNGGWAVLLHSKVAVGAPAGGTAGAAAIRPFSGTPFDGAHYCALDWHTIVLADIEPGPRQSAAATIADLAVRFTLDGAPLATTQTAVERFLNPENFGLTDAYYSQWGRVMAPSDLTVGTHTLAVDETNAAGTIDYGSDGITFYVDPPASGACS
jgi:hypothetical protein